MPEELDYFFAPENSYLLPDGRLKNSSKPYELRGLTNKEGLIFIRLDEPKLAANSSLWLYVPQYRTSPEKDWANLCAASREGLVSAVLIPGYWDRGGAYHDSLEKISIGCLSGATGKCPYWGYVPWKTHKGTSLKEFFVACVRMVRADYFGNGQAHTRAGAPIGIKDRLDFYHPPIPKEMLEEATWNEKGAVIVRKSRVGKKGLARVLGSKRGFSRLCGL
ncbi:hypothetical protein K2X33_13875 [bacterium]|nr:hypothetical protein [bacterium]